SGGGWQNPDNIFANDDALTVAVHTELASDWYLKTNGFGFDTNVIPSNAVILKVELQTKWKFEITG
ncbi:MAG TPA: hypothetical protein VFQ80_11615, partial [Thermomicrobiales bacterium]|nr:hypothetical protein [Thermomicrobiales bacterium]